MNYSEYRKLDGLALAALIKSRDVSAAEIMQVAVNAAHHANASLNFLKYERFEESLTLAESRKQSNGETGPFEGVPFLLKDSGIPAVRFQSSVGSRLLSGTTHAANCEFVNRVEKAGFIPFARTTVPEMCIGPATESVANGGVTNNPWGEGLSSGGSSGGAAAAVAAGIVPVAHGSDGGGSIRIPAANCGLVGLKVSRGRFPTGPADGETWGDLVSDGFLTRSVRDTAAALDQVQGIDWGAPFTAPPAPSTYQALLDIPFEQPLRIAVWTESWSSADPVDDQTRAAIVSTAKLCAELGHTVIDVPTLELGYEEFALAHTDVLSVAASVTVEAALDRLGRELTDDDLDYAIADGYRRGNALTAQGYSRALGVFRRLGRYLGRYIADYDLVLMPTVPVASMKHGRFPRNADFAEFRRVCCRYNAFTAIANASGQPAISVPVYRTPAGLPIGVQFLAPYGREDVLLRLARRLEEAAPWADSYPAFKEA